LTSYDAGPDLLEDDALTSLAPACRGEQLDQEYRSGLASYLSRHTCEQK